MRRIAQALARLSGWLSRRLGRGGGTSLPGMVLLKLRPRAAAELIGGLSLGSVAVSATNGKTTTARMIREIVDAQGWPTVANTAGANLLSGVTAALLDAPAEAEFGLFEVDEAALPAVVDQVEPTVVVLMNLFRDQLDRYGELEVLVGRWRDTIAELSPDTIVVTNADDPGLALLATGHPNLLRFGIDDPSVDRGALSHAADSTHCPSCNAKLTYDLVTIGHLGHWHCPDCGLTRPRPDVAVSSVTLAGLDGSDVVITTPRGPVAATIGLPGLHNVYNAAAATAAAVALHLPTQTIGAAVAKTDAAFGRSERLRLDDRELVLLLAKNPAGANENVRTVLLDPAPLHLVVALNDRTADGQDVSWIWDVDYEPLFDHMAGLTLTGTRAHDLALRFRYGGMDPGLVHTDPDLSRALDHSLAGQAPGGTVYVLPTYTAMLDLRAELVRRGVASDFWEEQ